MLIPKHADPRKIITVDFTKTLESQYPLAIENVKRLRRAHPDKTPGELIEILN